jgi:hypothetical protein
MVAGIESIIEQLGRQKSAIEAALSALRGVDGMAAPESAPEKREGGVTAAGRRQLSEALKKRRAAKWASAREAPKVAPRKRGLSPEGRKRLAAAMRKRWALAKAMGTTPIDAGKKTAAKKVAASAKKKAA